MSFFISDAMAEATTVGPPPSIGMESLVFTLGLVALMFFFIIRPQMKRQKEHKKVVDAVAKGDEVQTEGGLAGKVVAIGDNFAQVEIAKGVEVKIRRQSILGVMPKGTLKEL
ncbi:Protein translocase subunit YajC [hydrothermal vent metagenome]|uniref:Protein translocase subunit YajC n=1 Tax=hydrothermal vent metagenome TaxID=652676 RepID=A0A3B1C176_9ZZZZ